MQEKEIASKNIETLEANKLIAEFDGYRWPSSEVYTDIEVQEIKQYEIKNLKYHISWDRLMPVVEKIESLKAIGDTSEMIGAYKITIDPWDVRFIDYSIDQSEEQVIVEVNRVGYEPLIIFVWEAVFEFVKWHNQTIDKSTLK